MTLFIKLLLLAAHPQELRLDAEDAGAATRRSRRSAQSCRGKLRDKQGEMNFEAQRKMNEEMRELYPA